MDLSWTHNLEDAATSHAIQHIVPAHFEDVKARKEAIVIKSMAAVKERLTKEIAHWYNREQTIRDQELAGKTPKLNSAKARQRAERLELRLHERMQELEQERRLSPLPPNIIGGALILPRRLLDQLIPALDEATAPSPHAKDQEAIREIERIAMEAVMRRERELGNEPRDVSKENLGYDIESREPENDGKPSRLRFIEVKGRAKGATTVTVTRNEVLCALNEPDNYILAIGIVDGSDCDLRYVRRPFTKDVEFSMTTVGVDIERLFNEGRG